MSGSVTRTPPPSDAKPRGQHTNLDRRVDGLLDAILGRRLNDDRLRYDLAADRDLADGRPQPRRPPTCRSALETDPSSPRRSDRSSGSYEWGFRSGYGNDYDTHLQEIDITDLARDATSSSTRSTPTPRSPSAPTETTRRARRIGSPASPAAVIAKLLRTR
jgi:hypothetical protein